MHTSSAAIGNHVGGVHLTELATEPVQAKLRYQQVPEPRARVLTVDVAEVAKLILAKFCKFLAGSFSAVSKRTFARKYAFDSIFQALQDLHTFAPLQSQNFRKKSV